MNFKSTKDLTNGKCLLQVLIINSRKPFYFKFRDFTIENNSLVFSWRIQIAFSSVWYCYQCGRWLRRLRQRIFNLRPAWTNCIVGCLKTVAETLKQPYCVHLYLMGRKLVAKGGVRTLNANLPSVFLKFFVRWGCLLQHCALTITLIYFKKIFFFLL